MDKKSKRKEDNKQPKVPPPFHQRFNIEVQDEEARQRFLNRVGNRIFDGEFFERIFDDAGEEGEDLKNDIMWVLANSLGNKFYYSNDWDDYVSGNFYTCLQALEVIRQEFPSDDQREELDAIIQTIISEGEIELGVSWRDGKFWPSGAKLLDEALVNENLEWLVHLGYDSVRTPFEKGLRHLLEAHRRPERLADTVTDMYEALEALAKIATGRPSRDLSANAELFVSKLKLSDYYKKMLKDYIEYANEYRHAVEPGVERKPPLSNEVEAFVYTTGLFIRLAIQQLATT